ncbi:porin [Rhodohalobacter sp. 8-1]|uniref:porin n=1 Tax=Rhodohalobacter sp. 8-1 TaxID=3131972 RepID=UPI0030EEFC46
MKCTKKQVLYLFSLVLIGGLILGPEKGSAQSISFESDEGWIFNVTGQLPVFLVASNHDGYSADGSDQFATRVMSGFNPGSINFNVVAPEYNGITVEGIFRINHHLQGPSIQNAGLFEGRVADIIVSGNFGTINMGKGFGVFNSSSIADAGSGMGVGRFAGPDAADATLGRIGSGYTYANFNPRLIYTTPSLGGFSLKVGLINPEKPGGPSQTVETATPRVEAQANYLIDLDYGTLDLWAGSMYQNVNVVSVDFDYAMSGWDVGARLDAAGFRITGAYSGTKGVGADGLIGINLNGSGLAEAEVDATQWYAEGMYTAGKLSVGISYGEGSQDAVSTVLGSSPEITNQLLMGFTRYKLTDNLTWIGELQNFESEAQANYQALVLGMQLNF